MLLRCLHIVRSSRLHHPQESEPAGSGGVPPNTRRGKRGGQPTAAPLLCPNGGQGGAPRAGVPWPSYSTLGWLHTDVWTSSSSYAHPHRTAPVGSCPGTLLAVDVSTRSPCWCAERLGVGAVSTTGVQSLGRPGMESGEPRSLLQHHDVATVAATRLVLRFRGHLAHDFRRWYSFTHLPSLVPCSLFDRYR
jgi:hypothetical protein